jgi:transcriptional regulator with XRE-family HTH domain
MNDTISTPKVCIDGNVIKRIREANKLTQLYVAKVVGVTTDTVSRWENNRYPSIRRENALLLAEALEVDLPDILLNGTGEPGEDEEIQDKKSNFRILLPIGMVSIAVIITAFFYFGQQRPVDYEITSVRVLPSFAVSDGTLPVRVRLQTSGEMKGVILREHFPQGWKLIQASPPPSSLDNVEGIVRWILKPDEKPMVISYLIQVPASLVPSQRFDFSGELIVNPRDGGVTHPVAGDDKVHIGPFHWADDNGDLVIDDGETLAASESIDEMVNLHLSWETIEKIWDAGRYRWDAEARKFIPLRNPELED